MPVHVWGSLLTKWSSNGDSSIEMWCWNGELKV